MAGLDLLARKSVERGSEVSILIPESLILKATAKDLNEDDDDWSWRKLRDIFDVKNAEFLFAKYQARLQHSLYMLAVMTNIVCCLSALLITWVNSEDMWKDEKVAFGIRLGSLCASLAIYVVSCQESWFLRNWSRVLASVILILIVCMQEMATSVQVLALGGYPGARFSALPTLISSVFLPLPRWYQVFLSTTGVITTELIISGFSYRDSAYFWSQIGADIAYHVGLSLIGLYIRFLMEFTNRKAFLDRRECFENKFHLEYAKEQEERLLLSVLPKHIAVQVRDSIRDVMRKHEKSSVPQRPFTELFVEKHRNVSILYADIVNSVELTSTLHVSDLVEALNDLFGRFDECAERNFCLRIKLLGDCYQCVSGVPDKDPLHADHCVQMGLDMIDVIRSFREESRVNVDMRIGVHSGNVLSGLLGLRKWQFDIWSRDVTIASRMEQTGTPGCVHVTKATKDLLQEMYCIETVEASISDEYLIKYNTETFLIHPGRRNQAKKNSMFQKVPSGSNAHKQSTQGGRLSRKQSFMGEVLSSRRRTVLGFSLLQFRQMVSQVNQCMDSAIDVMALNKKDQWFKSEGIQPLFLTFRNRHLEKPFLQQQDPLFKHSLLCALFTACVLFVISALSKPRLLYIWLACTAAVLVALISIFSFWIRFIWKNVMKQSDFFRAFRLTATSVALRMIVFLVMFVLLMSAALIGMEGCPAVILKWSNSTAAANHTSETSSLLDACQEPWNFTRRAILVMTSASVFLKVHFFLKLLITGGSLAAYASLDLKSPSIFSKPYFQDWSQVPSGIDQCWSLAIVCFLLHLLDRQVEYIGRLDYLWERKLRSEQEEASFMGFVNQTLLTNILPVHVAHYYLSKESIYFDLDLYHEQYNVVAVMFASIPNYMDYYTESLHNDEGRKCLQVLHEIICDFDKLLYEPPFLNLEKIKTIGSTYMAAAGLQPGRNSSRTSNESFRPEENATQNVLTLTKFAFSMIDTLEELNKTKKSLQDFKLRIGISVGPVLAGVVGVSKPQYDIWGDTVNIASRMDSTGITGTIQVTESVASILTENSKIHCDCRGRVFVKGKGLMTTYLIRHPQEITRL